MQSNVGFQATTNTPDPSPFRHQYTNDIAGNNWETWEEDGLRQSTGGPSRTETTHMPMDSPAQTVIGEKGSAAQSEGEYAGIIIDGAGASTKIGGRALLERTRETGDEDPEIILVAKFSWHCTNAALESVKNLRSLFRRKPWNAPRSESRSRHCRSISRPARARKTHGRGQPRLMRLDPPRPPKRVAGIPFQPWGGWDDLFNCIVSHKDRSQFTKHSAESIVNTFSQLHSRQRRIPMSDGRSRARRRRGLIRDMLRSCIECSLRWLQSGGLRLFEAPSGRRLRQLASRAAQEACCTSPLEFSGDKRGRLREVLTNIVNRVPPSLDFGSLRFSAGPAQWSYDGSARRPAGALRVQSARIALPGPAYVVSLDDWPPKAISQSFDSPAATDKPIAPSFFNVSMSPGEISIHQWSSVVRRMVRCRCQQSLFPATPAPLSWLVARLPSPQMRPATDLSVIAGLRTVNSRR